MLLYQDHHLRQWTGDERDSFRSDLPAFFTTKNSVGNGLGLWVSKQIVEKHGGSIQVRSHTSETPLRAACADLVILNTARQQHPRRGTDEDRQH